MQQYIDDTLKHDVLWGFDPSNKPTVENLAHSALCLCGESGELANVVKKIVRDGPTDELFAAAREELVDVVIYVCKLCMILGMDFDEEWEAKYAKLRIRWKDRVATPLHLTSRVPGRMEQDVGSNGRAEGDR